MNEREEADPGGGRSPGGPRVRSWGWDGERMVPGKEVPPADRGFRYGMSVFESIRVADGTPEFFGAHADRLRNACRFFQFPYPESAVEAVRGIFRGIPGEGFARIHVTAGAGGPTEPVLEPGVWVNWEGRGRRGSGGLRIGIAGGEFSPVFGGLKTGNYWPNLEVLRQARAAGWDDALLRGGVGQMLSGCVANVFVVERGRVRTPALDGGVRAGVLREWVCGQVAVEEGRLEEREVWEADEIFLTNSWMGVAPVVELEGRPVGSSGVARDLSEKLEAARRAGLCS